MAQGQQKGAGLPPENVGFRRMRTSRCKDQLRPRRFSESLPSHCLDTVSQPSRLPFLTGLNISADLKFTEHICSLLRNPSRKSSREGWEVFLNYLLWVRARHREQQRGEEWSCFLYTGRQPDEVAFAVVNNELP